MPLPPWSIELLRRGFADVANKAGQPETLRKLKTQATELLQDLPDAAARTAAIGLDRVMRSAESGKESVRRWTRKQTMLAGTMLNASGQLVHQVIGTGVPVCDTALEAAVECLRGDAVLGDQINQRLQRRLTRVAAASNRELAITSSFSAALSALALLADHYSLVVHRRHAVRLPSGDSLPDAINGLLPIVHEVGGVEAVDMKDFDALHPMCLVQADVGSSAVEPLPLSDENSIQVAVLTTGTFADWKIAELEPPLPSALGALDAGFDLVVLADEHHQCGIVVGRSDLIQTLTSAHSWDSLAATSAVTAMTLVALETAAHSIESLPLGALLTTSIENLKGRVERLATRLSADPTIASTRVTDDRARITANGRWTIPSRQLRVRRDSESATAWRDKLRADEPSLWVGVEGDEIIIDLRWIAPGDDAKIATAVGTAAADAADAAPEPEENL